LSMKHRQACTSVASAIFFAVILDARAVNAESGVQLGFEQLIEQADAVVVGTIASAGTNAQLTVSIDSIVRVESELADALSRKSFLLRILDHDRWIPYAVGQRFLFFLRWSTDSNQCKGTKGWTILGDSREGEMPVVEGTVFARQGLSKRVKAYDVYGRTFVGTQFSFDEIVRAVDGRGKVPPDLKRRRSNISTKKRAK